jgi:hypothetical protein
MLSKENFSKLEREIENAIFGKKILRRHLKVEILNQQSWKQEYKVFYRNDSNERLKYVMLPPRRKEVTRNLLIYDSRENRLATVPSYIVEKALCGICEYYISEAHKVADDEEREVLKGLVEPSIDFGIIFSHDSKEKNIKEVTRNAQNKLSQIASRLSVPETAATRNPFFYIDSVLTLLNTYEVLYIPIVKPETPVKRGECFSIRYSVENLQEESISTVKFRLSGILSVSIPFELEKYTSNHIMILSPKGLLFTRASVTGLEGTEIEEKCKDLEKILERTEIKEKYEDLSKFLDDDMIYFNVSLGDTEKIHKLQNKGFIDEKPGIKFDLSIGRISFQRPSLIRTLLFLMYVSIFIPTIAFFVFRSNVTFSLLIQTLILEVTILVSIGVYAMDKPFLPEYITIQVLILLLLFIVQIYCLYRVG